MKDILLVIPARYKSTRFPGKPLMKINEKSMLKIVWEKCIYALHKDRVLIATEDKRILDHCIKEGMSVILTSDKCKTGTDRVFEVSKKREADTYINVQGDEPMILAKDIKKLISFSKKYPESVINGMTAIKDDKDYFDPNIPKVVTNERNELIYMSRSPIPGSKEKKLVNAKKQVCIYAFPRSALRKFGLKKKKTPLEEMEDIEILRFLELGYKVRMMETEEGSYSVDTPKDLKKVRGILK